MQDRSINQDDLSTYVQDMEDIKQCWKNILFTVPGTFPLLPEFGSDLYKYVDKPVTDSFGKLRNVIIAALERFEPRAKINKVTRTIENERIWINLFGTVKNTGEAIISNIIIIPEVVIPVPTFGTITINKSMFDLTEPVDLFKFNITGITVPYFSDSLSCRAGNSVVFENIPTGTYTIEEVIIPSGFELVSMSATECTIADNENFVVDVVNKSI